MHHNCAICMNRFDSDISGLIGIGYTCDLSEVSDHFERLPSSPCRQTRWYHELFIRCSRRGTPPTLYKILVCKMCRVDLYRAVVSWTDKGFCFKPSDHRPDVGDCPICGASDQDGRTLLLQNLPNSWMLPGKFQRNTGYVQLSTCQACRGDFIRLLILWLVGDLIENGRPVAPDAWNHLHSWFDVERKYIRRPEVRETAPDSFFYNANRPLPPTALRAAR